ncbi:MAG: hypothetical protein AVDCRST_MAG32-1453 [uncultured Nocardioides sp.]|uniref:Uncharacterized protein n=1 Tax=uncultured Nocardioides sp. TaxID=198441 RepID=A0A6J4NBS6_9ACTN|nr:MAG: hypothetical protein AVDCRST_MAG32-1453 [uncultured Nocardioides sp.]
MPRRAVLEDLVAAPVGRRVDQVEIDLATVPVAQRERGGAQVPDHVVPALGEDGPHLLQRRAGQHEVEVAVLPGLLAQQAVDAPPAVQPAAHVMGVDGVEQVQHVCRPHELDRTVAPAGDPLSPRGR